MQKIWVVIACIAFSLIGGCAKDEPEGFALDMPSGCSAMPSDRSEEVKKVALDYFERNVGVPTLTVRILTIEDCENDIVVPIEATTRQVPTPRHWYVEFPGKNLGAPKLVRPM